MSFAAGGVMGPGAMALPARAAPKLISAQWRHDSVSCVWRTPDLASFPFFHLRLIFLLYFLLVLIEKLFSLIARVTGKTEFI